MPLTRRQQYTNETFFTAKIPINLCCPKCKPHIDRGKNRRTTNTCMQPWDETRWASHHMFCYVKIYNKACDYLRIKEVKGDILVDEYKYGVNKSKNKKSTFETDEIAMLSENISIKELSNSEELDCENSTRPECKNNLGAQSKCKKVEIDW